MKKADRLALQAKRERQAAINHIINTYGRDRLDNAKVRLCYNCYKGIFCRLLPLTTTGEDCPYFGKKGEDLGYGSII